MSAGDYPEHQKLSAVKERSQACGEFLEWLGEEGFVICKVARGNGAYYPAGVSHERLLAKHFGIDVHKLEDEKRAMLALFSPNP